MFFSIYLMTNAAAKPLLAVSQSYYLYFNMHFAAGNRMVYLGCNQNLMVLNVNITVAFNNKRINHEYMIRPDKEAIPKCAILS